MSKVKSIVRRANLLVFAAIMLAALSASAYFGQSVVYASRSNTRVDAAGTVEVAASDWLGGGGVDVYSNGNSSSNTWGNNYVNNVLSGSKWQCVEMVNRLYLTKGWTSSTWYGNGNTLVNSVPSGLVKENNDSISYLNSGDVITLDDGGFGHAAIINTVGSTIGIINQNTINADSSASITSGSLAGGNAHLAMSGWAGYQVQAIVHHPVSSSPPPYQPLTQHIFSGTASGTANETYLGPSDSLTTAQMAQVGSPVTAVSSQITSDGIKHIYFGTQSGGVYETYWGTGVTTTTSLLVNLGTPISAISSQVYNGVQHVYTATGSGTLNETSWGIGAPLSTWQKANIGSSVTSIVAYINSAGVQSIFSAAVDGNVRQTYWGGGNTLTTYVLAGLTNSVNSIAFFLTADGAYHIFSGTSVGTVYETYWGGGNALTTGQLASIGVSITGISAQQSNGVNHVYTGTQAGTINETYWGPSDSLTTSQLDNVGSSVTALSSQITANGIQHVYTGTASGILDETYWGSTTARTTGQLANFASQVNSISSLLT